MEPALPPRPFVYPIVDAALLAGRSVSSLIEALGRGGARIVQLRAKDANDAALFAMAREAVEAARAHRMTLVLDDRPDVAALVGAEGVHLGQEDLPPRDTRRILPHALLGLSTHNRAQVVAAAAEPVDYVAVGPVFATSSKAAPDPVVGLALVREARSLVGKPLVAIGGITRASAAAVVEAGADGVAVISEVMTAPDPARALEELQAALGPSA